MRYIIGGFALLGTLTLYSFMRYMYELYCASAEGEREEEVPPQQFGDCPKCGLPAEVPTATITREYYIHCLGEHEPLPVKEVWIQA